MTLENQKLLDHVGWQILRELQEDARLSFTELGRRVGLSLPAVAERVRRMEEAGIILGYRADVNTAKIGVSMVAFIRLTTSGSQYPKIIALAQDLPEVMECHHLTGTDSFIMKVIVSSIAHLETLITRLSTYGQTTTSIVLSSPVVKRIVTKSFVENGHDATDDP
ncbi:MAG: Lrp/AsnC family transcriptional regulator [Anaerolineae bacterium]|nr:Lrp/AsnC family transcriptional regulator [Anaerolineae bacterium]